MTGDEKLEVVTEVPDRAMVIFAHPDDAEIGSGGVVATVGRRRLRGDATCSAPTGTRAPPTARSRRPSWRRGGPSSSGPPRTSWASATSSCWATPTAGWRTPASSSGDVVRAIRRHRPHTVFVHDPYRMKGFQHRDHRKAGIVTTDAVYPYARDHLHFPEHVTQEGLEPHKVRELWYWGVDEPDVIVDVTDSIDRQIAALVRHESQVPGFNVPEGETIGERVKKQRRRAGGGLRLRLRRRVPAAGRPAVARSVTQSEDGVTDDWGRQPRGASRETRTPAPSSRGI